MTRTRYPLLYQVNTRVWLTELARELHRPATLDDVPDAALDQWAALGFNWIWFLSVWQTGAAGQTVSRTNPAWRQEFEETLSDLCDDDIPGSGFAITGYNVHEALGGDAALARLRQRLSQRGLRLLLDFVPNHTGLDHPWVEHHPEYYIAGTESDLASAPQNYTRVARTQGDQVFAYGRDPYFAGWPDTLQLNYGNAATQEAMIGALLKIADQCDGVRCDMAMLVLPEVFQRTWGIEAQPFWPHATQRMREKAPDFCFMAEVYWDLEWTLQQQGFDYTYDKRLYDRLRDGQTRPVREHFCAGLDYQDKMARFLENHDEPRAAAVWAPRTHEAAAVLTYLAPGLRFFHQGQFEGHIKRVSPHLGRRPDEPTDPGVQQLYQRLLAVLCEPVVRDGQWQLLDCVRAWEGNWTWDCFVAFAWNGPSGERLVVVVNYAPNRSQCFVRLPWDDLAGGPWLLRDQMDADTFERDGHDLQSRVDQFDEAEADYRRCLEIDGNHLEATNALGNLLRNRGRLDEALAHFERALALDGNFAPAHCNRAMTLLAMGRLAEGFAEHEWRLRFTGDRAAEFTQPVWDGSPLPNQTLFVHHEQGLGDTIQFLRYLPLVRKRVGRVILGVSPRLMPLLEQSGYGGLLAEGSPLPPFDVHAPLASLPHRLGTTLETIPAAVPYLAASPRLVAQWREQLAASEGFKIGIVWHGTSTYPGDRFRSIPLACYAPLAAVSGVRLFSLQKGTGSEQIPALQDAIEVVDLGSRIDNETGTFMDTAAIMKNLDLVVASDTSCAHLAGALNVNVWIALQHVAEWRWLRTRDDSPWYPSVRLFRQPDFGDWPAVFQAMARELRQIVGMVQGPVVAKIAEALSIAFAHHQRGELARAEEIYRQIVAAEPAHADAWHLLGVAAHQAGRNDEAVQSIARAVSINGSNPAYLNHLGAAYAGLSQFDEAEEAFRLALALGASDPQIHYNLADLNLRSRKGEAAAAYHRAIALAPNFAEAHFNLGNLLRDQGDLEDAEKCYAAALVARPTYVKAAMSLASLQMRLNKPLAAEGTYRRVLELDAKNVEAHYWLGSILQSQQRLEEAAQVLVAAVFHDPRHVAAQNNLGCVYRTLGKLEQAEQCFRLALDASPEFAEAMSNLGSVLHDRKRYDEAAEMFRRALAVRPDFAQAYNNLGTVHQDQKHFDQALECYRQALALDPDSAESLCNVGMALHMKGHVEQAVESYRRAIASDAGLPRGHFQLGAALHSQGADDEALAEYAEAIRLKPDYAEAYYNRSFVRLTQGDLQAGWQDYEWRFKCTGYEGRTLDAPRWDGSPLAGRTLLVYGEQGLGDTLHFIRYLKVLERMGGQVFFEAQPILAPLLKASGFGGVIPRGSPLPRFDVQIPLMSLPFALSTTLATIPAEVPYLAADARLIKSWRSQLRSIGGFKVGAVWQGNPEYVMDHFRSYPLAQLAPLAEIEGVQLVSLQKHAGTEQTAALEGRFTIVDLSSTLDTTAGAFMDTAAVMCNLDLVVTSDTAAAHLAGGLGVPVWLALPTAAEWRWLRVRSDSPWYPSMRLFRQSRRGEWTDVFAQMKEALAARLRDRSPAG